MTIVSKEQTAKKPSTFSSQLKGDDFDMFQDWYTASYTRTQPFLFGILTGYILWQLKGKEVKMHWVKEVYIVAMRKHACLVNSQTLAVFGWICTLLLTTACVFGLYSVRRDSTFITPGYSVFEAAFYNGFAKIAWSLALMWVVFACVKGYGGVIDSFLSWGFFKPLARMNYIAYLIHYSFISVVYFSLTYTVEFTDIIAVKRKQL